MRNPLAPIRNALFVLDHAEASAPQARRAKEVIGRQVLHLSRIVDDLLDVTRIARGKIHLHPTEVDLGPLVRRVVEDHRGLFAERELDLVAIVPQDRIPVKGDETRLAQVHGIVEPAPREQAPRERGEPPPSRRRRVLVVDDNRDAAESMAQLLELLGHDVRVAYDGEAGLAMARAHPPDLILCDIGLPGMDGYAVAREVRHGGPAGVRLIAVSGYARPEDVERATQAGFEAHLAKPPDPNAIQGMLE